MIERASEEESQQYHTATLKPTTHMGAEFDHVKESKFISYLDGNNFYGWAMSTPLPTSAFVWMSDDDWKHVSCFLEVDLEYPEQLHNIHNDYPLAPERVKLET